MNDYKRELAYALLALVDVRAELDRARAELTAYREFELDRARAELEAAQAQLAAYREFDQRSQPGQVSH